jgi:hypothetical protein
MTNNISGMPRTPGVKHYLRMIERPLAIGLTASLLHYLVAPDGTSPISILGVDLPQHVGVGVAVAAAAYTGEIVGAFVKPKLPRGYRSLESVALDPALAGTFSVLMLKFFSNASPDSMTSMLEIAGIGAGSFIAGDYVQRKVLNPLINQVL